MHIIGGNEYHHNAMDWAGIRDVMEQMSAYMIEFLPLLGLLHYAISTMIYRPLVKFFRAESALLEGIFPLTKYIFRERKYATGIMHVC